MGNIWAGKNDTAAIERVAQYMLRNPFALSKMTYNRFLSHLGLWDSVNAQPRPRAPPRQAGGAYPVPREAEQYVIVYETYVSFDGMDELPTIIYD